MEKFSYLPKVIILTINKHSARAKVALDFYIMLILSSCGFQSFLVSKHHDSLMLSLLLFNINIAFVLSCFEYS